jgi:signal transduction histidine kinase
MRLVQISLAAKYRILFGLAVLLILAAALSVPWMLLSHLVYAQPYQAAQRIADAYFRDLPSHVSGARPAAQHGVSARLLAEDAEIQPSYVRVKLDPQDPLSIAHPKADPFAQEALRTFLRHPKRSVVWEARMDEGARQFAYAHAIRVTRGCLDCHEDGRSGRPFQDGQLAGVITLRMPAQQSAAEVLYYRAWLVLAGALGCILAILVFYLITRRFILSPIHELREMATRVADGELDVRASIETGDEFEQLSDSLNTMLERLRASQEELKKANKLLDQKLGEMAETNVALYESNRLKSEFVANVSHELRTPLTSIIGFAELLREGPLGEAGGRTARYAENILISGRILLEIINDLLDLAKIEAGKVELHLAPVQLDDLCNTLIDFVRPTADKKKIDIAAVIGPDLPTLLTDRGKLRQILFNLLSNAIKFSPEGGRVRLAAERLNAEEVRLSISDTGPGIAIQDQRMIFEKFRQIDQSVTREHQGTGLGLAIARELTLLLGGEISVESELGQGATFWLVLPVSSDATMERPLISLV